MLQVVDRTCDSHSDDSDSRVEDADAGTLIQPVDSLVNQHL